MNPFQTKNRNQLANLCWSIQWLKSHNSLRVVPDQRCQRAKFQRVLSTFWCDFRVSPRPQNGFARTPNFVCNEEKTCYIFAIDAHIVNCFAWMLLLMFFFFHVSLWKHCSESCAFEAHFLPLLSICQLKFCSFPDVEHR